MAIYDLYSLVFGAKLVEEIIFQLAPDNAQVDLWRKWGIAAQFLTALIALAVGVMSIIITRNIHRWEVRRREAEFDQRRTSVMTVLTAELFELSGFASIMQPLLSKPLEKLRNKQEEASPEDIESVRKMSFWRPRLLTSPTDWLEYVDKEEAARLVQVISALDSVEKNLNRFLVTSDEKIHVKYFMNLNGALESLEQYADSAWRSLDTGFPFQVQY